MNPIQILLVLAALLWLGRFLVRLRAPLANRLLAVVTASGLILLVLKPELSTRIAGFLGVTRGVDVVIYLGFVVVGFLWLHNAARVRDLELRLTRLARELALEREGAVKGDEPPPAA